MIARQLRDDTGWYVTRVSLKARNNQTAIPDAWEKKYARLGLDPADASDASGDYNGDGYTNIEKYINGMDPEKLTDWTDLKNNYDTLAKNKGVER